LNPLTLEFIDLLVKNNRLPFVEGIARKFNERYKAYKGITEVRLTTVSPLDKAVQKNILKHIVFKINQKVSLEEIIDPEIIGGFIIKIEDEQVDASVKTRLNKIKKELVKNSAIVK
jgi:F-type H+-transporting ATPase subunit delta